MRTQPVIYDVIDGMIDKLIERRSACGNWKTAREISGKIAHLRKERARVKQNQVFLTPPPVLLLTRKIKSVVAKKGYLLKSDLTKTQLDALKGNNK